MYKSASKRRQIIRRTVVYTAMTLFVAGLVSVLVLLMLGYRFNRQTNTIEQGGLVQFISYPAGASVTVGSAHLIDTTPSKITVNPGHYLVKMERSGYRSWQKSVDVESGTVLWLNYAQLVPDNVTTEPIATFKTLSEARESPNGRFYALLPDATKPLVTFVDMADSNYRQSVVDSSVALGKTTDSWRYSLVRWSDDGDYLLMKRSNKTTTQWLLVDRRDQAKTQNLSVQYKLTVSDVLFHPRSSNRLIVRSTDGVVRTVNVSDKKLSDSLLENVTTMNTYDNSLFYVQKKSATTQSVGYLSLDRTNGRELLERASNEQILVAAGSYYGDIYISVTTGSEMAAYRLSSLPSSNSTDVITTLPIARFQTTGLPLDVSVRTRGRFMVVQTKQGFITYDIELAKMTSTDLGVAVGDRLNWIDSYHVGYVANNHFTIIEFDGENRQEIANASVGYDGSISNDNKYAYSFLRTAGGVQLQRSLLTAAEN